MPDRRAIVCYVGDVEHLIQQALALRHSWLHVGCLDTDLVMMGPADVLARLPNDVVKIAQRSVEADPEWRGYRFADSVVCLNAAGSELLDRYTHILRTDVDTFITPAWHDFHPTSFTFGNGHYSNDEDVRRRIRDIAQRHGLVHRGITNVNSTWYGPTEIVRRASAFNEMLMKYILNHCFVEERGTWPGWYWGVASLYAGEIAVNHCAPDAQRSDQLDALSTSREPVSQAAHIHCWHLGEKFSKHAFMARQYTAADMQGLDLNIIADYCMEMSVRSLQNLDESNQVPPHGMPDQTAAVADAAIPAAPRHADDGRIELTIGMPTYKDFDGVYFTLQTLRLYQDLPNTELLVIDNYGCEHTRELVEGWPQARYVLATEAVGTAVAKDLVFREARGEAVLCCDSHVLFAQNAIARLKQYFREHPACDDLLQGPLLGDDVASIATHFDPVWRGQMWGIWSTDPRGLDPEGEPFEIPMQGLGVFACRRSAWLGFNERFRGFGGEEGYLHEKYRQAGRRCLCLPWLRWMHRFARPAGVPYPLTVDDKLRNYIIGHAELGLSLEPVLRHFAECLPNDRIVAASVEALWEGTVVPGTTT